MTYCVGIITRHGLVMASDSRSNAGYDQVQVCRKMHTFIDPGGRVFMILNSGSLSLTQSVLTHLRRDWDKGEGLFTAASMYDAARVLGEAVRHVSKMDREYLERDEYKFNINFILGGQVHGEDPGLYLVYPQGNPLHASADAPFLQIGESKYGRPILDRGIRYHDTPLDEAVKYALISLDSTMRSNATVGPPIDLAVYHRDELDITRFRRLRDKDPDLIEIRTQWELTLRKGAQELPSIEFDTEETKRESLPNGKRQHLRVVGN